MEIQEKKSKTIIDAEKEVLSRQGEEGSALNESERIISTSEYLFLRDLKKRGIEVLEKNHLDVWFVQNNGGEGGLRLQDIQEINRLAYEHNKKSRSAEKDDGEREYSFKNYDSGDLKYYLEQTYQKPEMIQLIPEIVVIQSKLGEHEGSWLGVSKMIQSAVDNCINRLNVYWEDKIISHLGESVCYDVINKFEYGKIEMSEDNLIEYGLIDLEMIQREWQKDLFEKYIFSGNQKFLEDFFSDETLREMYDGMCVVPEEGVQGFLDSYEYTDDVESDFYQQFKGTVDHIAKKKEWEAAYAEEKRTGQIEADDDSEYEPNYEEMNLAVENYWVYRENIAQSVKLLNFEDMKDKMRQAYVARIKSELDRYAPRYIHEYEIFEAEKKLLKPILVYVSENPVQRELMRDCGADVVLEKFSSEDVQTLLELAGKIKASSSSLVPEKLRRVKAEFYRSVEDKLDARSEITAETEKEIKMLHEIFQQAGGIKKVLDVACGNGRVSIPLLEKGYEVTGIDANEKFLQSALRKVLEKNIAGAHFKAGDAIDYHGVIEAGSQDAVMYTWHSILEAFGLGNLLRTLGNSWSALRPGGVLVFDQPTRENPHMEDGWYGNDPDSEHHYLSYIMDEDEIKVILKMAGFEKMEIRKWTTKPSEEYPDGMHKFTVSARKPEVSEEARNSTQMFRNIINQTDQVKEVMRRSDEDMAHWLEEYEKRKSV